MLIGIGKADRFSSTEHESFMRSVNPSRKGNEPGKPLTGDKYSTSRRLATNSNSSEVMSVWRKSCKEGLAYPGGS